MASPGEGGGEELCHILPLHTGACVSLQQGGIGAETNHFESIFRDKFELICHDIFDETFLLPEKVDCVVLSYTLTTFISNYDMLAAILKRLCVLISTSFQSHFMRRFLTSFKSGSAIKQNGTQNKTQIPWT